MAKGIQGQGRKKETQGQMMTISPDVMAGALALVLGIVGVVLARSLGLF
jgi:hypothetical protein